MWLSFFELSGFYFSLEESICKLYIQGRERSRNCNRSWGIILFIMFSWVHACVKTQQIIPFKFVQFMICQLHLSTAGTQDFTQCANQILFYIKPCHSPGQNSSRCGFHFLRWLDLAKMWLLYSFWSFFRHLILAFHSPPIFFLNGHIWYKYFSTK